MREKRDIKPLILKLGLALALSLAGFVYSRLRSKRVKPSLPPRPKQSAPDIGNEVDLGGGRFGHKDDLHASETKPKSCNSVPFAAENHQDDTYIPKVSVDNTKIGHSPRDKHTGDKDGFLLPEFGELLKEFDLSATNSGIYLEKDVETPRSDVETPKTSRSGEIDGFEREIKRLTNMVRALRERERSLEVQLLEYYGLKEQETAVMELQNRLRINNVEAKLFTLKIESLQGDNRRLEAQQADRAKIVSELEAARGKIKMLKKKLRSESEQNKEQILNLQKRVAKLQDPELKGAAASDSDTQSKLQRLKELEVEAEELRNSNLRLQLENSELGRRLESTQILATSILEHVEAGEPEEVRERLRQENEDMSKEIEQLQADRCADVEELVYLRWVNACLRYELRNYQPPSGKTAARDLSKTLSPKSEEKAKQLILEYANSEGTGEKEFNASDFDSDQWSQATESVEYGDSPAENSSSTKINPMTKTKFLSKLRRLIQGHSHHHSKISSADKNGQSDSSSPRCSSSISTGMDTAADGQSTRFTTPLGSSRSFDIQQFRSLKVEDINDSETPRRNSDLGSTYEGAIFGREGSNDPFTENRQEQGTDSSDKSELAKYATVLKHSRSGTVQLHRKSVSYTSI